MLFMLRVVVAICVFHGGATMVLAADRDKLLTEPGVFATFAVFKVEVDWWRLDRSTREAGITAMKEAWRKHDDKVAADAYLLRGLSETADLMIRVHASEMVHNQNFLLDLMATPFGRYWKNSHTFNGLTKKANYVPSFPDDIKAGLKAPLDPSPRLYAIVVPIRKDADWWLLDQQTRVGLMQEHTQASLPYLKAVKRKLYHSNGLDDLDFITYFETAKLDDFNSLIIGLESVRENKHNRRFGNPTLLGTIRPLEEILSIFSQ
jgi:chlorite dismutase